MRTSSAAIAQVASMVSCGAAAPAGWLVRWQDCHVHVHGALCGSNPVVVISVRHMWEHVIVAAASSFTSTGFAVRLHQLRASTTRELRVCSDSFKQHEAAVVMAVFMPCCCPMQDLPAAAVAGLNRITTRALARRQHQRQPDADSIQEQQQQPLRQRQSEQQKRRSWRESDEADGESDPDSSGTDSDRSDDVSSGSSSEVDSARQHSRTPPRSRVPRSQHRGSPAQGLPADGGVGGEGVGGVRRRQPRSGGQTAAAAAANRVEPAE